MQRPLRANRTNQNRMAEKATKIVIIGGGFGGLFTALDLAATGEVTLINDQDHWMVKPMLYEYLSGEVEAWHIAPDFKELLNDQAHFVRDVVTDIDLEAGEIGLASRRERVSYDVLVFAPGAVTSYSGVEGAEEFALPFRTLNDADH